MLNGTLISSILYAQPILWQEINIPMPEAGPKGLEGLLVWPNTPGKWIIGANLTHTHVMDLC